MKNIKTFCAGNVITSSSNRTT